MERDFSDEFSFHVEMETKKYEAEGMLLLVVDYIDPADHADFFQAIADSCDLPVVLYNVPRRTAVGLTIDTIERQRNEHDVGDRCRLGIRGPLDPRGRHRVPDACSGAYGPRRCA